MMASHDEFQSPGLVGQELPTDLDCSEVVDRLFVFIDQELDQADCGQIEKHLEDCQPCLAKYNLERTVKTLVSRSCTEVAPSGLRERVLTSIREVRVTITEE
ncbi:hypothetical protein GCM10011519_13690 [Marmoricola endophyticus]|uniref:Putative zinc-finger domain-containing protein n=2 Tax=Marmoricola endophyticus TaxID=2040280 RepID=A0A917F0W2_9ACTN|nr:hypothetical protein GCM10011519_13690 [Marmoricola endophyticus]